MKKLVEHHLFFVLLLVIISSIAVFDLTTPGLPLTHDGRDHVARIANFYRNLTEGNLVPRWAPYLNWGYGHPVLMFLYPLPSYVASLFHFIGFSLVDSVKLVFGVTFMLSGLTMYLFVQSFGNKYAGFIAAMLYMFAPYRFVDLYVRGAIGEHVAFLFAPLVFYFLYKLSRDRTPLSVVLGSISLACLILSHNAISLMFLPLFGLFSMYLVWSAKNRLFISIQVAMVIGFGFLLSAFFWVPALLEGKYTLRDIVTENEYSKRFESLGRFIYSQWNYGGTNILSVQVGIVQWLLVLLTPVFFLKRFGKKQDVRMLAVLLFVLFWVTIFLMVDLSKPLYEILTTLQKFQFPWRFLTIIVFVTALMGGLVVYRTPKRYQHMAAVILTLGLLFVNSGYWHAKGYEVFDDSLFTGVYEGTTDTGESSPIWSVRFMEQRPTDKAAVIDGDAEITILSESAVVREYEIIAKQPSRILENTLYFPGWNIVRNSMPQQIEFQDPMYRGLMTYEVPEGEHRIRVEFTNTKLRSVAEWMSLVAIVGLGIYILIFSKIQTWKRFR